MERESLRGVSYRLTDPAWHSIDELILPLDMDARGKKAGHWSLVFSGMMAKLLFFQMGP
jgi:hypothetical protein